VAQRRWIARYATMRLIWVMYAGITDVDLREAAEASGFLRGRRETGRRGS